MIAVALATGAGDMKASKRWTCQHCGITIHAGDDFVIIDGTLLCFQCGTLGEWFYMSSDHIPDTAKVVVLTDHLPDTTKMVAR